MKSMLVKVGWKKDTMQASVLSPKSHASSRPSPRPRLCVCWPMAPVMKPMKSAMKSSGMTLSAVYSSVAETTGLKQKQARGVVEGIMGVAADQLK